MPQLQPKSRLGLYLGTLVFLATLVFDSPFSDLPGAGWQAMGLATLMAIWWMSECVPLPVTSLAPLIAAPLAELGAIGEVASAYAHPLIFLFMGGFILSIAIERVNLHLRIARQVIASVGSNPRRQIGSMMAVTAFLSMWISNTATAVMMLPIALSVSRLVRQSQNSASKAFGPALLLGIAYSASIGGLATIIGTPPNALLVAYLDSSYDMQIGFGQWMLFGIPFSAALLLAAWLYLTRKGFTYSGDADSTRIIREELKAMGPMKRSEKMVLAVFCSAALSWILRSKLVDWTGLNLSDTGIAMTAALLLFALPTGDGDGKRLLEWKHMERLPWGVLVLFGGGLALAALIQENGLADFIGRRFEGLQGLDIVWVALVVGASIVFLTEVTSNTATAAGLLPLMGPVALSLGEGPASLAIPAAIAASCAFMLPVATPPNAIVFASGELKIGQMARAGFGLNLIAILFLGISVKWLIPYVF